ncbi:MAG: hypothetical protein R6V85_20635, partial [Polyangia bacterium]
AVNMAVAFRRGADVESAKPERYRPVNEHREAGAVNQTNRENSAIPFLGAKPAIATRSGIDDLPNAPPDSIQRHQSISTLTQVETSARACVLRESVVD